MEYGRYRNFRSGKSIRYNHLFGCWNQQCQLCGLFCIAVDCKFRGTLVNRYKFRQQRMLWSGGYPYRKRCFNLYMGKWKYQCASLYTQCNGNLHVIGSKRLRNQYGIGQSDGSTASSGCHQFQFAFENSAEDVLTGLVVTDDIEGTDAGGAGERRC